MARFALTCEIEADTLAHAWAVANALPVDFSSASVTAAASLGLRSFILRKEDDDRGVEVWLDVEGATAEDVA